MGPPKRGVYLKRDPKGCSLRGIIQGVRSKCSHKWVTPSGFPKVGLPRVLPIGGPRRGTTKVGPPRGFNQGGPSNLPQVGSQFRSPQGGHPKWGPLRGPQVWPP